MPEPDPRSLRQRLHDDLVDYQSAAYAARFDRLADLAEAYWARGRLLRPTRVVDEFEKTILDELDMYREAANASQLRRNFAGSDRYTTVSYTGVIFWVHYRHLRG